MPLIAAEGWGWRHAGRKTWAIHDLTFAIEPGERVLLLGPSGAGKSTLLLALAGVLGGADEGTEAGQLLVDGQHPSRRAGQTGLVRQDPESQVVLARVGDDVAFGCENLGMPPPAIWPRVRRALDAVELDVGLDHLSGQLSGGQQQRLVLAGALAMHDDTDGARRPRLLLLDEPTANLDPDGTDAVRRAIGRIVDDRATALIVVEHHVDVWLDIIDRVIVLGADGSVAADGRPGDVFAAQGRSLADQGVWVPGIPLPVPPRRGQWGRFRLSTPEPSSGQLTAARQSNDPVHPEPHPSPSDGAVGTVPTGPADGAVGTVPTGPADGAVGTVPTGPALRGVDLAIGYSQGHPVREHLDIAVPAGLSTVITGPNGVGKSTLALTLAGLLPQLDGRVEAMGDLIPPAADLTRRQRRLARANGGAALADPHAWTSSQLLTRLGTVFQQPEHQFVTASVRAELAVGLEALRWPAPKTTARVDELLATLHLDGLADANPFTLSGGEKRRLSVGTVLASGPAVIILDEPTFGQDRATWCDLVRLIGDLLDGGHTVVSVTHDRQLVDVLGENRIELGTR